MRTLLLLLFLVLTAQTAAAQSERRVVDLRGTWLFQIGQNPAYSSPGLDDHRWGSVFVPSAWENEGFAGYDGYAWYRRHFKLPATQRGRALDLDVGRIDDVDRVWVNGHFVGSTGRFPDEGEYQTAYDSYRRYRVPPEYLNESGDNVIAVQVYDDGLEGGILEGSPGLYETARDPRVLVDLTGPWQFSPGNRPPSHPENGWTTIHAPGYWEAQGFRDLNGMAWYRKTFDAPRGRTGEPLALLLGRVDDLDDVWLNGKRIGSTGKPVTREVRGDEWYRARAYAIPPGLLRVDAPNVLLVRVYDGLIGGGIYEGPLAIATPDAIAPPQPSPLDGLREWWRRWISD